MQLKVSYNQYD